MVNVGAGTFIFGMSFNEMWLFFIVITVLMTLTAPIVIGSGSFSFENYPGSVVNAFNYLWLDNFSFITGSGASSCYGAIRSINLNFNWDSTGSSNPIVQGFVAVGQVFYNFEQLIWQLMVNFFLILNNCALKGIRFFVGLALVYYFGSKILEVLSSLSTIFMFFKSI